MNNRQFFHKNIIITGGSSGIGLAIAKKFSQFPCQIALLARDKKKLEKAKEVLSSAHAQIKIFVLDVSRREEVEEVFGKIIKSLGQIDILINNAGISTYDFFAQTSVAELEYVMQVNYFGALYCTKAAWPWLKSSSSGYVVFTASIAGYMGLIGFSSYSPSKFAMVGLAESLRMEGVNDNIHVMILFPPDTKTPMLEEEKELALPQSLALSKNAKVVEPDEVADRLLQGMRKKHFEVFCNAESKLFRIAKVLFPRLFFRIVDWIAKKSS
jgi:3-dehydrosphinganine reductase